MPLGKNPRIPVFLTPFGRPNIADFRKPLLPNFRISNVNVSPTPIADATAIDYQESIEKYYLGADLPPKKLPNALPVTDFTKQKRLDF